MSLNKSHALILLVLLSSACSEEEEEGITPSHPDYVPDLSQVCTPPDPMQGVDPIDHLIITEISEEEFSSYPLWFELYNPTDSDIDVTGYKLTTTGYKLTTTGISFVQNGLEHTLPAATIPAKSYFVFFRPNIKSIDNNINNKQLGFLPVMKDSKIYFHYLNVGIAGVALRDESDNPIDFVRFGETNDHYLEAKPGEWIGENASMAADITKTISMIRKAPYQDTDTKADWGISNVLTPGGDNFFAEGADQDHDGIPDAAEDGVNAAGEVDSCEYFNGQLLYRMGARPNLRNIFVEINMQKDLPHSIEKEAFVQAREHIFTHQQGINYRLTFDIGDQFSSTFDPDLHNLRDGTDIKGGGNILPKTKTVDIFNHDIENNLSVANAQYKHQDLRRKYLFHYAVIGHKLHGTTGAIGRAEPSGTAIALGFNTLFTGQPLNYQNNIMGITITHELGHNFSLMHGGDEHTNKKPNYISLMNYLYGEHFPLQNAADPLPWFAHTDCPKFDPLYNELKDTTDISISTGPEESFVYSFSHGNNHPIEPMNANESRGVHWSGGPQIPIDFNCNGTIDMANISATVGISTTLHDHNDWDVIKDMINVAVYQNNSDQSLDPTGVSAAALGDDAITPVQATPPPTEVPICPAPKPPNAAILLN